MSDQPRARRYLASFLRVVGAVGLLTLLVMAEPQPAFADHPLLPTDGLPIIAGDQQAALLALVAPYSPGQPVTDGWLLDGVAIDMTSARFVVKSAAGQERALVLGLPERVPQPLERTLNFALTREGPTTGPPSTADPLDALAAAVRRHDVTPFWRKAIPHDRTGDAGDHAIKPPPPGPAVVSWPQRLQDLLNDGVLVLAGALLLVVARLRRLLCEDPPWVTRALLGLVLLGVLLRALLSPETLMEAWAYDRMTPLAARLHAGPTLHAVSALTGGDIWLTTILFKSNFLLASLTPLVLYAHARYVLKDHRSALVAAALLVVLPVHLRFSRSDVYMVQSLATSSLTFVMLYTALLDRSRGWTVTAFLVLPLLCSATYLIRPENIVFVALDLAAIYICTRGVRVHPLRTAAAVVVVVATALAAFLLNLWTHYSSSLEGGLSWQTLSNAKHIFFSARLNTVINPWITPLGMTALAFVGARALWRRGDRQRAVFLVSWLVVFFVVHSFVRPFHAAMQARYHMNLMTPFLLLVAAATPTVLAWRPWLRGAVAAYLVASPWLHRDFIADTSFNEMREFAFLTTLRAQIPPDCTVLEYTGLPGEGPQAHPFASRLARVSAQVARGKVGQAWRIVPAAAMTPGETSPERRERLSLEALAVLAKPPTCLVFYEGLTCASLHRPGQARAPVCQTLRDQLSLQPLATTAFSSRVYDPVNSGYLTLDGAGRTQAHPTLPDGAPVVLTAFRAAAPGGAEHPSLPTR